MLLKTLTGFELEGAAGETKCPAVPIRPGVASAGHGSNATIPGRGSSGDESTSITWVRCEDGRERPLPVDVVSVRSDAAWPGIHLEETRCRPGELPEGHLRAHVVVLNLLRPVRTETCWVEGRNRNEVTIAPNGVTILPAGLPFAARWRDPVDSVLVAMSPQFVASVTGEGAAELRPQLGSEDPFVAHLLLALRELACAGEASGALYAETLGTALAARLLRSYGVCRRKLADGRGALSPTDFKRVAARIDERLGEPLTLHDLAALAGMSVFRFARMFKACAGVAPHHYVLERRLERARALLHGTSLPVGRIAVQCGFSHPSHFTTTFQRVFAITPTRYRQVAAGER